MPDFSWSEESIELPDKTMACKIKVKLTGKAMPQHAAESWAPFLEDLQDCFNMFKPAIFPKNVFTIDFHLSFYNTSSNKFISTFLSIMQKNANRAQMIVNWYYLLMDEDSEADAEMYRDNRNFNKIKINLMPV